MLSSAKMGRASWRYYLGTVVGGACEYYSEHGDTPGRWHGNGLASLGLIAGVEVQERELEALFARAISPSSGVQLGAGWRDGSVTGYDLTFSAPKSVSTLWALGDEVTVAQVEAAHGAAVRAGLRYLEQVASGSRRGRNGIEQIPTAGYAAALFDHGTSRTGDPQLHTHCLVANKVRCVDGAWRTLDGREVYHHKKAAGALYQAALRAELSARLSVRFGSVSEHGQAEITGTPTELMSLWSTRTAAVMADATPTIAATEADLGRPLSPGERARVIKTAVLATRPPKHAHAGGDRREVWASQADAAGWDRDRLTDAVTAAAASVDAPARSLSTVARVAGCASVAVIAVSTAPAATSDDASRADPVPLDVIGVGAGRAVRVPDDANPDDGADAADRVRLLTEAVTAVGRTKAVWSRADLTVAIAARIDTLTEPAPTTAAAMTTLVEQLTDTALTSPAVTAAMTPATPPSGAPMTDAMTPADPTEPTAASSGPVFASSPPAFASSGPASASSPSPLSVSAVPPPPTGDVEGLSRFLSMPRPGLSMPSAVLSVASSALPIALSGSGSSVEVGVDVGVVGLGPVRCGDTARASDARYASRELVEIEARVIERVISSVREPWPLPKRLHRLTAIGPCSVHLTGEQQRAVLLLAASEDLVTVLSAPAGAGKTTTLAAAVAVWQACARPVITLAPSARAAAELAAATSTEGRTVASWLTRHRDDPPIRAGFRGLDPRPVILVDEASMLTTTDLDELTRLAHGQDASLVLVGDPGQLGAVNAPGGMFEHLLDVLAARRIELTGLHRYAHGWEAAATLRLRDGDPTVLDTYLAHGRIHPEASSQDAADAVFHRWHAATQAGRDALMLAASWTDVTALNARARAAAITLGQVTGPDLTVIPTTSRSSRGQVEQRGWRAGDLLITKHNTGHIHLGNRGLRNGDRFRVLDTATDSGAAGGAGRVDGAGIAGSDRATGSNSVAGPARRSDTASTRSTPGAGVGLRVQCLDTGAVTVLPAWYLARHVEYGWAATIDSAQGATTEVAVLLARPGLDREHLYVAMSRGRAENHVHASAEVDTGDAGPHHQRQQTGPAAGEQLAFPDHTPALDLLARAVATSGRERTAHAVHADAIHGARESAWAYADAQRPVEPVPDKHARRITRLERARTEQATATTRVAGLRERLAESQNELAGLRFWSRSRRTELTTAITTTTGALGRAELDLAEASSHVVDLTTAVQHDSDTRDTEARTARQTRHDTWAGYTPQPYSDPVIIPERRRSQQPYQDPWASPDHSVHHGHGHDRGYGHGRILSR